MRKIRMLITTVSVALVIALGAAQKDSRADAQLQAAINKETVEGDLKSAIELYKKIAQAGNRAVAAKALVRMGQCYEKLGDAEARKAYERAIREFGDQTEAIATARARLAAVGSPRDPSGIPARPVWARPGPENEGRGSPDGRYP